MFNRLMTWLVPKLEDWCQKKGRVLHIHGTDAPEDVYLVRYFLLKTKFLSIYIHRFLRSDRDDHHDHPFDFLSYVVTKGYTESIMTGGRAGPQIIHSPVLRIGEREPGTWGFRKAETIHMVALDQEYKLDQAKEAPLTIIFRGPYRREWGFWKKYPNDIFPDAFECVYWRKYLNVPESDKRE